MKRNAVIILLVVFLLLLFFLGKTLVGPGALPQTTPQKPVIEEPSVPETAKTIIDLVKNDLSRSRGIPVDKIKLISIDEVEWTNSCLNYQSEDEVCLQVITSGYKIILSDGVKTYEYHTDKTGKSIRSKESKVETSSEAIGLIQANFEEVSKIKPNLTPKPFDPDNVSVLERGDRLDIVFQTGSGDCPAGCLNSYYWYFSVWQNGQVEKMGEFSRVFVSSSNSYEEKGLPLWGIPR
ncbi:MAG: hypothetical protein Q8P89_01310 [bacterium]|nr:hypothetical protein [bacterium]